MDPTENDPDYDWRGEVDWPHVHRLIRLHGLYWAYGLTLLTLYYTEILIGATRTVLGVLAYLGWAALLIALAPLVKRGRYGAGSASVVSLPTFLILIAFMASLLAYIALLHLIGMDTIELF